MIKRQYLIMVVVFIAAVIAMGWAARSSQKRFKAVGPFQEIRLGDASMEVSPLHAFTPPESMHFEGWEKAFVTKGKIGTFVLAQKPCDVQSLAETYKQWFSLPSYSKGPLLYEKEGARCFFQEIPLHQQGVYVIQKQERQIRLITSFVSANKQYWVQFETSHPFQEVQEAFHLMLGSLKISPGLAPDAGLLASLDDARRACGWKFFQPIYLPFLIPLGILLLIFVIQLVFRFFSGFLPAQSAGYQRNGVEISVVGTGKLQLINVALVVSNELVTFYTYGTPFLVLARNTLPGRVRIGTGWFGMTYVQLDLQPPLDFRKGLWKMRGKRGVKVKVYTRNATQLATLLGG